MRITSPTASSGCRKLQYSVIPLLWKKVSVVFVFERLSLTMSVKPGTRYEVWRARA